MSCETLLQAICEAGHLFEDGYVDVRLPEKCPHCGAAWVWSQRFDVTNGGPEEGEAAVVLTPAIARPPTAADRRGLPAMFPCGCSHLKVSAGFCDQFRPDGNPREPGEPSR